ncbi:hypothetical protein ACFLTV_02290 [Chloroflexota bacterium]
MKTHSYLTVVLALVLIITGAFMSCGSPQAEQEMPLSVNENPRYIYQDGAILIGADYEPIELGNNPNATNPTYAELVAFIKKDTSDSKIYSRVEHLCADFAEEVHNNAEAAGIRAAWVGIDIEGEEDGHAVNAFQTTDRGLVYVDCTGKDILESTLLRIGEPTYTPTSWDKIAYVKVGKAYGVIYIDYAESLSYDFYETYQQKWQECEEILHEYNDEVVQFHQEIAGKVYHRGSLELAWMEARETILKEKSQLIEELAKELGYYSPTPLGIVENIHIHWGEPSEQSP